MEAKIILEGKISISTYYVDIPFQNQVEFNATLGIIFQTIYQITGTPPIRKHKRNEEHYTFENLGRVIIPLTHLFNVDGLDTNEMTIQLNRNWNINKDAQTKSKRLMIRGVPLGLIWVLQTLLSKWHLDSPAIFPKLQIQYLNFQIIFSDPVIGAMRLAFHEVGLEIYAQDILSLKKLTGLQSKAATTMYGDTVAIWVSKRHGYLKDVKSTSPVTPVTSMIPFLRWDVFDYEKFTDIKILETLAHNVQGVLKEQVARWGDLARDTNRAPRVIQKFLNHFDQEIKLRPFLADFLDWSKNWEILKTQGSDLAILVEFASAHQISITKLLSARNTKFLLRGETIPTRKFFPRILPTTELKKVVLSSLDLSKVRLLHPMNLELLLQCTYLTRLYIDGNRLTNFDKIRFEEIPQLEYLSLSHCEIADISDHLLKNCSLLQTLDLSSNFLTQIPDYIFKLPNISSINLQDNLGLDAEFYRTEHPSVVS